MEINGVNRNDTCSIAKVNSSGLFTLATSVCPVAATAIRTGKAFVATAKDLSPTAADDIVLYVKNTHSDDLLLIYGCTIAEVTAAAATEVALYSSVTGTPAGTTELDVYSLNTSLNPTPPVTAYYGSDITGLDVTGPHRELFVGAETSSIEAVQNSPMIVKPGEAFAIGASNSGAKLSISVTFMQITPLEDF